MQYKLGAKVYTSDNRQVGTVDHIVIEPEKKEVTHVVVRKGLLTPKDKVIPVSAVHSVGTDGLVLQQTTNGLDDFPDFEESQFVPSEGEWLEGRRTEGPSNSMSSYLTGYVPSGVTPGNGPHTTAKIRNIPDNTVPLKAGSKVTTNDNRHVGNVERVITNSEDGHTTHVMITQGLVTKTKKLIPTEWISHVMEDELFLKVDAQYLDSLPEYQPEMNV